MAEARDFELARAVADGDPVRVTELLPIPEPPASGFRGFVRTPEAVAANAEKQKLTYEKRREEQRQVSAKRRQDAADQIVDAFDGAIESDALGPKTNEELADLITYRMAKAVLLGGEFFAPTSLKEVNESAATWSKIATAEANRRRGKLADEPEQSPVQDLAERLSSLRKKAADRARAKAVAG